MSQQDLNPHIQRSEVNEGKQNLINKLQTISGLTPQLAPVMVASLSDCYSEVTGTSLLALGF